MKRFSILALVTISVAFTSAQDADTSATETQVVDTATSGVSAADKTTSASAVPTAVANPAATEAFKQRWKADEEIYKRAGLPDEKIEKMRKLDEDLWKSRAAGEKLDYRKIVTERNGILSPEEQKKLQTIRRDSMRKQLRSQDSATSNPQ